MQTYTKQTLKIFFKASLLYWPLILVVSLGVMIATAADLAQPLFYRSLVNFVSKGDKINIEPAVISILAIFGLAIVINVAWRIILWATNIVAAKVKRDLYRMCYEYVIKHSVQFFSDNFVGSLVSKITRFDRSYEKIYDEIVFGGGRTLLLIASTLAILAVEIPLAAVFMGAWTIVYIMFAVYANRFKQKYDLLASEADSKSSGFVADSMTNSLTVKLFATEKKEKQSFDEITEDQYIKRRRAWDWSNYIEMVQGGLMVILEVTILLTALWLWQNNQITVGDFVLLQSYMLIMFDNLWNFGRNIRGLFQSLADANEMTELLLKPYEVADSINAKKLKVKSGLVQFNNVNFGYSQHNKVFSKFSLEIKPGEKVALVGTSGGGKTTVTKLLFRFYDISSGEILVDGQNIANVTQESLRQNISLVPQDPILFHRSLLDNIRYAKPYATEKEVIAASKAAHCHEFISKLPQGYKTLVGERGVKLSGGERQRVAIARAILKNAPILVLDEATSALDSESEMLIQDAMKKLMENKTTIVIAHRLSTIMAMDRIIVIESGKIIEQGKHEELLKAKQGKYQKLWNIQAGSFS